VKKVLIAGICILAVAGLIRLTFGPGFAPGPNHTPEAVESRAARSSPTPGSRGSSATAGAEKENASRAIAVANEIQRALDSKDFAAHAAVFEKQIPALVKLDPWAAARLAEASPEGGEWRTELLRTVAQKWAAADPEGASKWIAQLSNPNERDTVLSCACFQIADLNPSLAIQTLIEQGVGSERREVMLGNLAQQWAAQDVSAAAAWARSCQPGRVRDALFLHIAIAQSKVDPEDAAAIVSQQIAPGSSQEEAALAVMQAWAKQDGEGALAWANRFPPGALRDRVLREVPQISAAAESRDSELLPRPQ
jgi:hypothetical protein